MTPYTTPHALSLQVSTPVLASLPIPVFLLAGLLLLLCLPISTFTPTLTCTSVSTRISISTSAFTSTFTSTRASICTSTFTATSTQVSLCATLPVSRFDSSPLAFRATTRAGLSGPSELATRNSQLEFVVWDLGFGIWSFRRRRLWDLEFGF